MVAILYLHFNRLYTACMLLVFFTLTVIICILMLMLEVQKECNGDVFRIISVILTIHLPEQPPDMSRP